MYTTIEKLPAELRLEVARNVPNLWSLALVSKSLFQICTVVLIERIKLRRSVIPCREACYAICCMSKWVKPPAYVINEFCHNAGIAALKCMYLHRRDCTKKILEVLRKLPPDTEISDNQFHHVVAVAHKLASQPIGCKEYLFYLEVLRMLPANTKLPDFFIKEPHEDILGNICHWGIDWAGNLLDAINGPPFSALIPDDYYLDVATEIRAFAEEDCKKWNNGSSKSILKLLPRLPANTTVPKDFFFSLVAVIRTQALKNIKDSAQGNYTMLELIPLIPSSTSIPADYFLDIVEEIRAQMIQRISDGHLDTARRLAGAVNRLESCTIIPNGYFSRVIEILCNNRSNDAEIILKTVGRF